MKIICTLSNNDKVTNSIDKLISSGTNMFRINCSCLNRLKAEEAIYYLRKEYPKVQLILDLEGNKVQVDNNLQLERNIVQGKKYNLVKKSRSSQYTNDELAIPLVFNGDSLDIEAGEEISIDYDNIILRVTGENKDKKGTEVLAIHGGLITAGKNVNIPGLDRSKEFLNARDLENLLWGLKHNVDAIALSYVSRIEDIYGVKKIVNQYLYDGIIDKAPLILTKIQCRKAVVNYKSLIMESDGIIISRRELSCEVMPEEIPEIHDKIRKICIKAGKPLFLSDSILSSMAIKRKASISEIMELYYQIDQGINGIILGDESSNRLYPLNAVRFIRRLLSHKNRE